MQTYASSNVPDVRCLSMVTAPNQDSIATNKDLKMHLSLDRHKGIVGDTHLSPAAPPPTSWQPHGPTHFSPNADPNPNPYPSPAAPPSTSCQPQV